MFEQITKEDIFETTNEFLKLKIEGDSATEDILLGFAASLCGCSTDRFVEELTEYNRK